MTVLPIVARELRVAARRPATFWLRFGAALLAMGVMTILLIGARANARPSDVGQFLLIALGMAALGCALFAGVFLTADCLSAEKRDGTLGLLFLTDLKGHDVVLGKLAVTSLSSSYALLAVFPMLAMPVLMGGVTGAEFGRILLVLVAALFLSLTLGLFVSALVRETRHALAATLGAVIMLAGLPPLLWWLQLIVWLRPLVPEAAMAISPAYAYYAAFDMNYRTASVAVAYWVSLATMVLLGLLLLGIACWIVPRVWHEGSRVVSGRRKQRPDHPAPALRAGRVPQGVNPFHWLAVRDPRTTVLATWIAASGAVVWALLLMGTFSRPHRDEAFLISFCLAYALHLIVKVLIGVEATRRFSDDRSTGALELLLATPLSPHAILRGQELAVGRQFLAPRAILTAINLGYFWWITGPDPLHLGGQGLSVWLTIFLGGLVVLVFDSRALTWQGMLLSVIHPRHHRAVLATVARVLLPPVLLGFLWIFLLIGGWHMDEGGANVCIFTWMSLSIALDVALTRAARWKLEQHFRSLVTGEDAFTRIPAVGRG